MLYERCIVRSDWDFYHIVLNLWLDGKYLHLPVVENKSVIGLVNVLQLTHFVIHQVRIYS